MNVNVTFTESEQEFNVNINGDKKKFNLDFGETTIIKNGQNVEGENGATFIPDVSDDGVISWTNDKDLPNPDPVNIKGKDGAQWYFCMVFPSDVHNYNDGDIIVDCNNGYLWRVNHSTNDFEYTGLCIAGMNGKDGVDGKDGINGKDGYTPVKGVDYFDGVNGKDGVDGYTPVKGVDYFDGADGKDGINGANGERGTGILRVTTAPQGYTLYAGGKFAKKRMALSTICNEAGVSKVLVGDTIAHESEHCHVYYLDSTYAYMDTVVSVKGADGINGKDGAQWHFLQTFEMALQYDFVNDGDIVVDLADSRLGIFKVDKVNNQMIFTGAYLKGDKGDPYTLTDADKTEMVASVISALPVYGGEVESV